MQINSRFWLWALFISGLTGCGGSSTPIPSQSTTTPSPTPAASASPAPSPSPSVSPQAWQSLNEVKDCPYPDCPARAGFKVDVFGNFFYGTGESGKLSLPDLTQLTDQTNRVTSQNLSTPPACVTITPLPGMSSLTIDLTLADGSLHRVYDLNTSLKSFCWLGDRGRASQLKDTIDALSIKYFTSQ